jgi:AcrR family transcriptional regulator
MNGYEKRSKDKREAIVKAAEDLFAEKGISETSITEIASKANVSRVTLFKYFGDKEALAREILRKWIEQMLANYDAVINSDLPFQDKLTTLLRLKFSGWEKIGDMRISPTVWDDPELRRIIGEMGAGPGLKKIVEFIGQGKQSGLIDASLDDEAVLLYFSVFAPVVTNTDYIKKGKSFQQSLLNLFMGGLIKNWYEISRQDKT